MMSLHRPLKRITHRSSLITHHCVNWSDPGLSRNTRCCCYRCSVPGLAGFTKRALCGARDLISHYQLPIADLSIANELNRRLAVREHPQQTIDGQV